MSNENDTSNRIAPVNAEAFLEKLEQDMRDDNLPSPRIVPSSTAAAIFLDNVQRAVAEPQATGMSGAMQGLIEMIKAGPKAPEIGVTAAKAMRKCFELAAADVEKIAAETVQGALLVEQEAKSFSAIIREHGHILCQRIEDESARTRQVSLVLREVAKLIAEPAPDADRTAA